MSSSYAVLAKGRAALIARLWVAGYILLLLGIPFAALVARGLAEGSAVLWAAITAPAALAALKLTIWTSALMAVVNGVMGTATAWVLVRYRFPGRSLLSTIVDLPFAIPTLVAGIMLVLLFGPREPLGQWFDARGIRILFATPAIILALLFITVPFVVRAVEPVLLELDPAEEEAAHTLGAGHWMVFYRVILPALTPAIAYGTLQCFARAIAEFGSIVVVSGNIPFRTQTAPVLIFGQVESGRTTQAAAVSLVLLVLALILSSSTRVLRTFRTSGSV